MSKKKAFLSDKITNILSTAPSQIDPEDDIYEETTAKVVSQDSDEEISENVSSRFRRQNVDLLEDVDVKYVGKKTSRKDLKGSDEDWETEDEGLSTDEGEALDGVPGTQEIVSEDESEEDEKSERDAEESGDEEESNEDDDDDDDVETYEDDSNFKHLSDTNLTAQQRKGLCFI